MSLLAAFARNHRTALALAVLATLLVATAAGYWAAQLEAPVDAPAPSGDPLAETDRTVDTDGDTIPDLTEAATWGTHPERGDSDGDGLPDAWEIRHAREDPDTGRTCPAPTRPDAHADCAGKGLTLLEDHALGTDPWAHDTDGDGIPDAYEARHGMAPTRNDAEDDPFADGLTHRERYAVGARGDRVDTACSGMTDAEKVARGLDPARASTGGSGVPDGWALHWGLDPTDPNVGARHLDGDPAGLTVLEKARASFDALDLCARPGVAPPFDRGLDPFAADSDGDGLPDAWELAYDLDPFSPHDAGPVRPEVAARAGIPADDARIADRPPEPAEDASGDGLGNLEAHLLGACPDRPDCDDDGLTTAEEALEGWEITVDGVQRHVYADPLRRASSGGALPDGAKRDGVWEVDGRVHRFPPLDPSTPDTDGDGLPDGEEVRRYAGVLDPTLRDTDGDGIPDGAEVTYWNGRADAEPARADRLCATCAVQGGGAPPNVANPDSDGDGIPDGEELHPRPRQVAPGSAARAPFPASDPAATDTDGDGLPDAWERRHARFVDTKGVWDLDPSKADSFAGLPGARDGCPDTGACDDAARDLDDDGLGNRLELAAGTDPHEADTDGDGLPDGWEYLNGAESGARHEAAGVQGHGWTWHPPENAPVPLSPTDPTDADRPLATYAYARYTRGAPELAAHETLAHPASDGLPARIEGARTWTYRNAYEQDAPVTRPDSRSDGVPDLWKRLHDPGDGTDPLDALAADVDRDGDGLTNLDEFRHGTDPLRADTDLGGLDDGFETELGLGPLEPRDDAADGDLDGDGLTNAEELHTYGTRVDDVDTDGDGLLDGPSLELPAGNDATPGDAAQREHLLDRGIIHRNVGNATLRFLGEHEVTADPARECALTWNCAGDNLPDAWKVYHGLRGLAFYSPTQALGPDGMGVLESYRWARPDNWSEAAHGPWWLGLDPHLEDTDGDGVPDPSDRDLDGDGLDDLAGDDPHPFVDRANTGTVDVFQRRTPVLLLKERERLRADPPAVNATPTRLHLTTDPPATVEKGTSFPLHGHLRLADGTPAPAGVPVVVHVGDPGGTPFGVNFTRADGRFTVHVRAGPAQAVHVPEDAVALFGAPAPRGEEVAWTADSRRLSPGHAYPVTVRTYGVPHGSGVLAPASHDAGMVRITSAAGFAAEAKATGRPGDVAHLNLTLVDAAGDPHADLNPARVSLASPAGPLAPTHVEGANVTFRVAIPADAGPEPLAVTATYGGDATLGAGGTAFPVHPRIPNRLTGTPSTLRIVTGETLVIEGSLQDARGPGLAGQEVEAAFAGIRGSGQTDGDGRFSIRLDVDALAPLGARAPHLRFGGNGAYLPTFQNLTTVTVVAEPIFTELESHLQLGRGGPVTGRLLAAGAPVLDPFTGAPPELQVAAGPFRTRVAPDADGRFEVHVPAAHASRAGHLRIHLTTDESPLVSAADATLQAPVVTATRLSVDAGAAVRGEPLAVTGRLLDTAGNPVADAPVTLQLADLDPVTATTRPDGSYRTTLQVPGNLPVGSAPLAVRFDGLAPIHEPSGTTRPVRIVADVHLDLDDDALSLPAPRLAGRLLLDTGDPVAATSLTVHAAEAERFLLTDADGRFALPLDGLHLSDAVAVRLRAPGTPERAPLDANLTLPVVRATHLDVTRPDDDPTPGGLTHLGIHLTDDRGIPLADAPLHAHLNGTPVGDAHTGADGRATLPIRIPADAPFGPADLVVTYPGEPGHAAAEAHVSTHVRAESVVHVSAHAAGDDGMRIHVRVTTRDGASVPGESVLLRLPGYEAPLRVQTNADGEAELNGLPLRAPGTVEAHLVASATHLAATGDASLTVAARTATPTAGGATAAAVALVAVAVVALGGIGLAVRRLFLRFRRAVADEVATTLDATAATLRAENEHAAIIQQAYRRLVGVLARAGLVDAAHPSPRDVQAHILAAFPGVPADALERAITTFETVRYGAAPAARDDAHAFLHALDSVRAALRREGSP